MKQSAIFSVDDVNATTTKGRGSEPTGLLQRIPTEIVREILAFVTRAHLEVLQLTSVAFDGLVESYFSSLPLRRFKRLVVKETLSTATQPSGVVSHCLAQLDDRVDPSCIFPMTEFPARTRLCVFDDIVIDLICPEHADAGPRLQALLELFDASYHWSDTVMLTHSDNGGLRTTCWTTLCPRSISPKRTIRGYVAVPAIAANGEPTTTNILVLNQHL